MKSKDVSRNLRDKAVVRHRSGVKVVDISKALRVPSRTVALKTEIRKKCGTTRTLPWVEEKEESWSGRRANTQQSLWQGFRSPLQRWRTCWKDKYLSWHLNVTVPSPVWCLTPVFYLCHRSAERRLYSSRCNKESHFPCRGFDWNGLVLVAWWLLSRRSLHQHTRFWKYV